MATSLRWTCATSRPSGSRRTRRLRRLSTLPSTWRTGRPCSSVMSESSPRRKNRSRIRYIGPPPRLSAVLAVAIPRTLTAIVTPVWPCGSSSPRSHNARRYCDALWTSGLEQADAQGHHPYRQLVPYRLGAVVPRILTRPVLRSIRAGSHTEPLRSEVQLALSLRALVSALLVS